MPYIMNLTYVFGLHTRRTSSMAPFESGRLCSAAVPQYEYAPGECIISYADKSRGPSSAVKMMAPQSA